MSTSRYSLLLSVLLTGATFAQPAEPVTVTIAVLSLFHPQTLIVTSVQPVRVLLDSDEIVLPAGTPMTLRTARGHLTAQLPASPARSAARITLPRATFTLAVPGKLQRLYTGGLGVTSSASELLPVVSLSAESAVASIVAAEAPAGAAFEALKAQAVVARSFLLATPNRHRDVTACDTTHCQYLRAAPSPESAAARAAAATASLVLTWQADASSSPRVVAAMYSRSCGGSTRALHPAPPGAYPFFAVPCRYCQRHAELWSRPRYHASPTSERERIAFNRTHGWSAVPSMSFTESGGRLQGRGTGHGVGLCQLGAEDLARRGIKYAAILQHYFPAASVTRLPQRLP